MGQTDRRTPDRHIETLLRKLCCNVKNSLITNRFYHSRIFASYSMTYVRIAAHAVIILRPSTLHYAHDLGIQLAIV